MFWIILFFTNGLFLEFYGIYLNFIEDEMKYKKRKRTFFMIFRPVKRKYVMFPKP